MNSIWVRGPSFALLALIAGLLPATAMAAEAGKSPWGPQDEIGTLNMMTDSSRLEILARVSSGKTYDLSVEYHEGMPSWYAIDDPRYQFWMTHTPHGFAVDDPLNLGHEMNAHVSYSGDAISMYTHMGTHIDALAHFGLHGEIYNGFHWHDHLGDDGWQRGGAEKLPPIIARGVLIDVAAYRNVAMLPPSYRITAKDLAGALAAQRVKLKRGDAVFIRTGRMRVIDDNDAFMDAPPGIGLEAAKYLVEHGAMVIGADNLSLETFPVETVDNWIPVHTYLEAEQGVAIMEVVFLEELASDAIYEFAFIGASLKLRGASGAPMRPIALPVKQEDAR